VEDPFVRSFVQAYLARHGIEGVGLEIGQAIEMLRRDAGQARAIITNRPDGFLEFAELPLLYMAAFPDPEQAKPFRHHRMLRKPFRPEELLQAMRELLDHPTL
jgi:hypothetical protein